MRGVYCSALLFFVLEHKDNYMTFTKSPGERPLARLSRLQSHTVRYHIQDKLTHLFITVLHSHKPEHVKYDTLR